MRRTLYLVLALGCGHAQPPVVQGEPIPATPEASVDTMAKECTAVVTALEQLRECPNLEEGAKNYWQRYAEIATQDFAAAQSATPDPKGERAIALACRRASVAVGFANQRCLAGKPPPRD